MVRGTPNIRLFFQSKKESPTTSNESVTDSNMSSTTTTRPPLSAISASSSGRTNPSAASNSKSNRSSPQGKRSGSGFLGQTILYPHSENVDCNVGNMGGASTPEKFHTPYGTPTKSKSRRNSAGVPLPPSSSNLDGSTGGYDPYLSRTPSNTSSIGSSIVTSSDEEATTTDQDSAPSSTSESEAENGRSKPHGFKKQDLGARRISLGPKIEAAVSKLEKTPTKAPRPSRSGTPNASPGSLRAGVQRSLMLQQQQHNNKDYNSNELVQPNFELQEDLTFWNDHNVQVLIRCRPISSSEAAKQDFARCLRQDSAHAITWLGQPETRFTFDHVAGENISQERLFRVVGLPMVENCMAGYNSCMFAYGQTGSGKTHTMLGDIDELGDRPNDNRGMTPRIFEYLFSRIQQEEQDRQLEQLRYVCKCSFLEIYNEQITDLLEPTFTNLQLREDSKKGVYVENLTEMVVRSVQDVVLLLMKGASNRKVASTNMNRESSRSHSVFTCSIESKWETNSLSNIRFGHLNLVDLAGSERQKSSGAEGDRLKEAANINKSLSTLGLVIMILVDVANGKQRHVPYRDSKLTFLLQDSLGGNSKTAIIATVSPASCCASETLSTLKFAQRAKFIQNNAIVNEDASGEVMALRREIQQLKEEVSRLRCQTISSLRRDCRRESNEFFRMSLTGKDLFDAAEKERCMDEGEDLKSAELLEKIKALESVLAGALRREKVAEEATSSKSAETMRLNSLVKEREVEAQSCKKLLDLQTEKLSRLESFAESELSMDSYLTDENKMLVEKLEVVERLVECNPELIKSALECNRLAEQLRSYQVFYDLGERETMAREIQGLRDQVLELLDGKIAVERGSLSMTMAQDDNHRKELETCRNDLTNCLEASSQMQRHMDELQALVDQLTQQCLLKDKEIDELKLHGGGKYSDWEIERGLQQEEIMALKMQLQERLDLAEVDASVRDRLEHELRDALQESQRIQSQLEESISTWSSKYTNLLNEKNCEFKSLHCEWENATAKLLYELTEGDRVLREAEQEMEEILCEDWMLKSLQQDQKAPRWSLESEKSQKEVDKEHDYFQGRNSCNSDEIFVKRKRSSNLMAHGATIIMEEKLKLEGTVSRLELELEECKQKVQNAQQLQAQLDALEKEKWELQGRVESLTTTSLDVMVLSKENADLKAELEKLQIELNERTKALEEAAKHVAVLQKEMQEIEEAKALVSKESAGLSEEKLQLTEEIACLTLELKDSKEKAAEAQAAIATLNQLKLQAEEAYTSLQTQLEARIQKLKVVLEECQEENSGLRREIEQLQLSVHELQISNQELAAEKSMNSVLEEEKVKLECEVKLHLRKLEASELVQQELQLNLSSLHAELGRRDEQVKALEHTVAEEQSIGVELKNEISELASCKLHIHDLEASICEKTEALAAVGMELVDSKARLGELLRELEESRVREEEKLEAAAMLTENHVHQLQQEIDAKSVDLSILADQLQKLRTQVDKFQDKSVLLAQELEQEYAAKEKLQQDFISLTTSFETHQNLMTEMENELLGLREELASCECELRASRDTEAQLSKEMQSLTQRFGSSKQEMQTDLDRITEKLAVAHALTIEYQTTISQHQQRIEADANTIGIMQENVEELQSELSRKEELLQGLEFDISLLQEHTAEDTDFKQELLVANARILELQGVVGKHVDDLKALGSMKSEVEMEFAQKSEAMSLIEQELQESYACARVLKEECQSLKTKIVQLQSGVDNSQAELAEKNDVLCSLEKELMMARVTSTRMTLECSHKTEALSSVEGELARLSVEREELKKQLMTKVGDLQTELSQKSAQIEEMQAEVLVSMMTENCLQLMKADMEVRFACHEEQKGELEAELVQKTNDLNRLKEQHLEAREMETRMTEQMHQAEDQVTELQVERDDLKFQLAEKVQLMNALQDEISLASMRSAQSANDRDQLKNQVEELSSLKCELEAQLAFKFEEMRSLECELTATRARFKQMGSVEEEVMQKNEELSKLNSQLLKAGETETQMAEQIRKVESQVTELQAERDDLESQLAQKAELMNSLQGEMSLASMSVAQSANDRDQLKKQVEELSNLQCELEAQLASKIEGMRSLECELTAARAQSEQIGSVEEELIQKNEELSKLNSQVLKARETETQMAEQIHKVESQVIELQAERDDLESQLAQKAELVNSLQGEMSLAILSVAQSAKDRDQLKDQVEELSNLKDALEAGLTLKTEAMNSLEAEVMQRNEELSKLKSQVLKARETEIQMAQQMLKVEAQVTELQSKRDDLEFQLAQKAELVNALQGEMSLASTSVAQSANDRDRLNNQVEKLSNLKGALEAELTLKTEAMNSLEVEVTQRNEELSKLKSQVLKARETEIQMAEEMLKVEAQVTELQSKRDDLEFQLAQKAELVNTLQGDFTMASVRGAESLEKLFELEAQLAVKIEAVKSLECELEVARAQFSHNQGFLEAEVMQKNEELSKLNFLVLKAEETEIRMAEELRNMEAQITELQAERIDLGAQLSQKIGLWKALQDEISMASVGTAQAIQERDELKRQVEQMDALEMEVMQKNEELSNLNFLVSNARETEIRMEEQLHTMETQVMELQAERTDLECQLEQNIEVLRALQGEVSMNTEQSLKEREVFQTRIRELEAQLALKLEALASLEDEIVAVKVHSSQEIEDLKSGVSELQNRNHELEMELKQKSEAVRSVEATMATASVASSSMAMELHQMTQQYSCLLESMDTLNCELSQKEEVINLLRIERDSMEILLQKRQEKISKMECQIVKYQSEKDALEKELVQKTTELQMSQIDLETVRCSSDHMTQEIVTLKSEMVVLQGEVSQKSAAIVLLESDLVRARACAGSSRDHVAALEVKWGALQAERDSMKAEIAELKNSVVSSLEGELAEAKRIVDSSHEAISALEAQVVKLQEEKGGLEAALEDKRVAIISLEDELVVANSSSQAMRADQECLRTQIAELKNGVVSSLEGELAEAKRNAGSTHEVISSLEAQIVKLQEEKGELEAELADKMAEITSLEDDLMAANSSTQAVRADQKLLETQIADLQISTAALSAELTEKRNRISQQEGELAEAKMVDGSIHEAISALEANFVKLQEEKGGLEAELADKIAAIKFLEDDLIVANSSSQVMRADQEFLKTQIAELQTSTAALTAELTEMRNYISQQGRKLASTEQLNCDLRTKIKTLQQTAFAAEAALATKNESLRRMEDQMMVARDEFEILRAHINEQEDKLGSVEELLSRKHEALTLMVATADHATQECEKLKAEVEGLNNTICTMDAELKEQENAFKGLESRLFSAGLQEEATQELSVLQSERDLAHRELQGLREELTAVQSVVAGHKASALEAQKFAEVNILRANGKEEEARSLKASVSMLKTQINVLENQLDVTKREADKQRQAREELEMEFQGMKNRMKMLQAVHSTGSRNVKGFQAAQAASLDLQRQLEEKENEANEMYKKMTALHSQRNAQTSRMEEMEAEMAQVQLELSELQTQCEDKDAQIKALNRDLKEAETLTQDVMRDLHSVKLDISNYASLVSQQQLELISERARHSDESQEKDEELANLQTQLNQERQNWMLEMNHKQAEIVVARVLSEKMRLKNKTLIAEYKKLKADHTVKKKRLKLVERQIKQLTESQRMSVGTESEDFDEVQQFQALLAQANVELAYKKL